MEDSSKLQILYLEDSHIDAELVRHILATGDISCQLDWVANYHDYIQALEGKPYDLILTDFSLPDGKGLNALAAAKEKAAQTPVILVTGALGEGLSIETIRSGVTDYVLKTNLVHLKTAVPRAIEEARITWGKRHVLDDLRQSEERFELAVKGSGAGIWDWPDIDNEQMWWSPRFYELLGLREAEVPAMRRAMSAAIFADDLARENEVFRCHLELHQPYDVEFRVQCGDGGIRWLRARGQAFFDDTGKPRRMSGYVQDVSDRKQIQADLQARERDLLRAQEVANIGSWSYDYCSEILSWTAETYRIYGYTTETFDHSYAASLKRVHPGDLELVKAAWEELKLVGCCDYEHRLLVEDEVRWVREVAEIEYDDQGGALRAIGVVHDMSAQRRAEEEQRKSDEKYRFIADTAKEAIVMINATGVVTFWNPAAEKIFGYSVAEMLGKDFQQLLALGEGQSTINSCMASCVGSVVGKVVGKTIEVNGRKKGGKEFPLELSVTEIRQDGQWQAIGVMRDISERKHVEEERADLEAQLRQTQKMEAIGTLAGGIAHDFNNILASILGYSSMVERRLSPASREQQDIQEVVKAAERAKQLVRQILTFSRRSEIEKEPVPVDLIVKEVLQLIRASLPATIHVMPSLAAEGEVILGDSTQIHQVLMNLCTNAYHAMPDGGTLTVLLDKVTLANENSWDIIAGKYLRLQISDTGIGIDPQIIERIFDPYFTTKDIDSGTGLGLSVVRGIVTGLKGKIKVRSELGGGTTFAILFPCMPSVGIAQQQNAYLDENRGSEHILLIEDEVTLVMLGKELLGDLGYRVTAHTSCVEALRRWSR